MVKATTFIAKLRPLGYRFVVRTGSQLALGRFGTLLVVAAGCVQRVVPSPEKTARQWRQAVEEGNGTAAHSLLSSRARLTHNPQSVDALLRRFRPELLHQANDVMAVDRNIAIEARIAGEGGWVADLRADPLQARQAFRISSAAPFLSNTRRPQDALRQLRMALEHRSHSGLLRVLTGESRQAMETDLASLIVALEDPESASLVVRGRQATVALSGGHKITLEQEDGFWKVKYFD